ncbi:MAG: AAA family ATPase, partial [Synechococcaceae bacterium WB8_3_299]|nr:AAA family ATPase [Synechococcaceae bacterium WB8_3_299]
AAELKMEATSKPALVEEAEAELRRVERALLAAEQGPNPEAIQHQQRRNEALDRLEALQDQWQQEREQLQELRQLQQREEELRHGINEAERLTNWEEMARLQVELEHDVQKRRQALEQVIQQGGRLLRDQVQEGDIADVVARTTGIPIQRLLAGERQKLLELEQRLGEKVLGQAEAVAAVAAAIRRARAGMKDPRRPVGSFLFMGPTGVGKTELARSLAACLFDQEDALVRLDMSEFMERNAVARLIGAPPGYVGYEEGGQLTEAVRQRPYAVVLLDEVEKAVLLQLRELQALLQEQGLELQVQEAVVAWLARESYDPEYGARPLRRLLRRQLENPLATAMLEEKFSAARAVLVEMEADLPCFRPVM